MWTTSSSIGGAASCIHNELIGLETRHLVQQLQWTKRGARIYLEGIKYLDLCLRRKEVSPITYEAVVQKYAGPKKKVYAQAALDVQKWGVLPKDALLKAFVKVQKTETPDLDDPRIIQARSPKYNIAIARYHKPVEQQIYNLLSIRKYTGCAVSRMSAKGHNLWQRAAEIVSRYTRLGPEVVVAAIDASRFDGHVDEKHQRPVHRLYRKLCSSKEYRVLLARTLNSKGVTASGHKYTLGGRRASGDVDTSSGNTAIMLAMLNGVLQHIGVKVYDIYSDGDDALIFTLKRYQTLIDSLLPTLFAEMGHVIRYVNWAYNLEDIVFCRSKVVKLSAGYKMCRDPELVLATAFTSHKYFGSAYGRQMLAAYAYGYAAVHEGEPLLGPVMLAMKEVVGERPDLVSHDKDLHWMVMNAGDRRDATINTEVRFAYERAWGIPVEEQLSREREYSDDIRVLDLRFPITNVVN